jgi:hypothetical protein
MVSADFSGTFVQQDQMARPAINTVLLLRDNRWWFNAAIPSMGERNTSLFQSRLALNPVIQQML